MYDIAILSSAVFISVIFVTLLYCLPFSITVVIFLIRSGSSFPFFPPSCPRAYLLSYLTYMYFPSIWTLLPSHLSSLLFLDVSFIPTRLLSSNATSLLFPKTVSSLPSIHSDASSSFLFYLLHVFSTVLSYLLSLHLILASISSLFHLDVFFISTSCLLSFHVSSLCFLHCFLFTRCYSHFLYAPLIPLTLLSFSHLTSSLEQPPSLPTLFFITPHLSWLICLSPLPTHLVSPAVLPSPCLSPLSSFLTGLPLSSRNASCLLRCSTLVPCLSPLAHLNPATDVHDWPPSTCL